MADIDRTAIDDALANPEQEVQHEGRRTRYFDADDLIKRSDYIDKSNNKTAARGRPRVRVFRYKSGIF